MFDMASTRVKFFINFFIMVSLLSFPASSSRPFDGSLSGKALSPLTSSALGVIEQSGPSPRGIGHKKYKVYPTVSNIDQSGPSPGVGH